MKRTRLLQKSKCSEKRRGVLMTHKRAWDGMGVQVLTSSLGSYVEVARSTEGGRDSIGTSRMIRRIYVHYLPRYMYISKEEAEGTGKHTSYPYLHEGGMWRKRRKKGGRELSSPYLTKP